MSQKLMQHTHIAGRSSWWFPDISETITIAAIGILLQLARKPAMPTRAKAAGWMPIDGHIRSKTMPTEAPSAPPQAIAGAKTPPDPPEPTVNEVAIAFRKKRTSAPSRDSTVPSYSTSSASLAPNPGRTRAPRIANMKPRAILEGKTLRFDQRDIRSESAPFAASMNTTTSGAMNARL